MIKIVMFPSEWTGVGYYRFLQPAKYLNKLGLAEVRYPDFNKDGGKIKILKTPNENSLEEFGEWADIIVTQRIDRYLQLAQYQAMKETYHKPLITELDDNIFKVGKHHYAYESFKRKDIRDIFNFSYIKLEDVWRHRNLPQTQLIKQVDNERALLVERSNNSFDGFDVQWIMVKHLENSEALTTTTPVLAEIYKKYQPVTYILPNCIDFNIWDKLQPVREKKQVIIGWAGGGQHTEDLRMIMPVIRKILQKYPQARFHWANCIIPEMTFLWRDFPKQVSPLERSFIDEWPQRYARWNFDIGLVPLTDDEFNKGKSNLKWLENSARKIPTVASSVESYKVSIKHGETGFLANNQDEWVEHLSHLIENKTLRTRIGQQAYDEVKKNYNIETQVYKWANAYREVLANYKKKEADYGKEKLMDTGCNQPRTQGVIA